ncbi:MAG TPA: von Willebrand factor type A domain-containing protein [Thermoanaerobaculia bacterium]|nr:von Willebrand factor type A domain-containing protein [Thermoanaerobaculia bacterium]
MNSKRRAELQRKLSMGAVPRPPADLASRIKADIPQYLEADTDRGRFTNSVAFTMRVAASILMLITTAFITLRLLEPETKIVASKAAPQRLERAVTREMTSNSATTTIASQPAADEVRLEIAQEMPIATTVPEAAPAAPPPAASVARPQLRLAETSREEETSAAANDFVAELKANEEVTEGQVAGITSIDTENAARQADAAGGRMTITAEAPAVAPPTEAAASITTVPAPQSRLNAGPRRTAAAAPAPAPVPPPPLAAPPPSLAFVGEARASELDLAPPKEVFGISVDPKAFAQMKSTLEAGRRPPAKNVDVDALVNYFAGPPAKTPRRLMVEVEASPVPIEANGDHALLRFTLDAPRKEVAPRASTPPAATDVSVEVAIEKDAVVSFRRIGGTTEIDSEPTILHNVSVTALYQLELKPSLQMRDRVATVRLRYRSLTDGRKHMITRIIRGADFSGSWARASRRHRLASLGAIWSESLKGAGAKQELARAAEELATQAPDDARARELANAANATAGGGKR